MPDLRISQLPPVLTGSTSDLLVVVNEGVTKKTTIADILTVAGISADTNTFITGVTYSSSAGTLTINDNGGGSFITNGFTSMPILNLSPLATPPTGTTDTIGVIGDVIMGTDDNLYAKTGYGWLRFSGVTF